MQGLRQPLISADRNVPGTEVSPGLFLTQALVDWGQPTPMIDTTFARWEEPVARHRLLHFDTETTGLEPELGHRVVEIACIELNNHLPTGNARRWYLNPERDMPTDAFAVHGISVEFLKAQPRFAEIADEFLSFVEGAPLIIHTPRT